MSDERREVWVLVAFNEDAGHYEAFEFPSKAEAVAAEPRLPMNYSYPTITRADRLKDHPGWRDNPRRRKNPDVTVAKSARDLAELRRHMLAKFGDAASVDKLLATYHPVDVTNELRFYRKEMKMATSKKPTAKQLAARKLFAARSRAGTLGKRKSNPLTRVKVKSPSMLTKKAPTKRLVARRKRTARAPAGYYANPAGRTPAGYAVHKATTGGTAGALLAVFPNKAAAVEYGQAVADQKKVSVVIVGKAR
jgi:hypothetical protein